MAHDVNNDILKQYLDDIRNTNPISIREEQTLFRLVAKQNPIAREKLISANMRFVLKVALQYRGSSIPVPDLVSEGSMGLIRAIESFDPTRGLKFISYAVWWIKAYITRAINDQSSLIRLPANQHLRVKKAIKESTKLSDMSDDVQNLLQFIGDGYSLDDPINKDNDSTYSDMMADNKQYNPEAKTEINQIEQIMKEVLQELPSREAEVIKSLFGIDMDSPRNLREVGIALNISHERVRQLRDQAIRRIKKSTRRLSLKEKFDGYLTALESIEN